MKPFDAFVIECEYVFQSYEGNNGEFLHEKCYTCVAKISYKCDTIPDFIEGVSQNHLNEQTNKDVLYFDMEEYSTIKRIPKNIDAFFPNIKIFKCPYCEIESVVSDDLKQFPHLTCFYLGYNKIKTMPSDLFKHNPGIVYIGIESNRIENIGADLFTDLKHLKLMTFERNICFSSNLDIPHETKLAEVVSQCVHGKTFSQRTKKKKINDSKLRNKVKKTRPTKASKHLKEMIKGRSKIQSQNNDIEITNEKAEFCEKTFKSDRPWKEKFGISEESKPTTTVEQTTANLVETTTTKPPAQPTTIKPEETSMTLKLTSTTKPTTSKSEEITMTLKLTSIKKLTTTTTTKPTQLTTTEQLKLTDSTEPATGV